MITKKQIVKELMHLINLTVTGKYTDIQFELWDINELDKWNEIYEVSKYHSGYFGIGSNLGIEMLTVN